MGIFVKELWAFDSKETAIFVDLSLFCAATSVESLLNQGTLYSTADWEGFNNNMIINIKYWLESGLRS